MFLNHEKEPAHSSHLFVKWAAIFVPESLKKELPHKSNLFMYYAIVVLYVFDSLNRNNS